MTMYEYLNNIIEDIAYNQYNNIDNVKSNSFIEDINQNNNFLEDIKKYQNNNNYKLNIFDNNEGYDIPNNLTLLKNIKYKDKFMYELSNSYNFNILKNNIIDYLNKPDIPTVAYIPYLADFIIENISLIVDGTKIDEIKDAYMYIYHNICLEQ